MQFGLHPTTTTTSTSSDQMRLPCRTWSTFGTAYKIHLPLRSLGIIEVDYPRDIVYRVENSTQLHYLHTENLRINHFCRAVEFDTDTSSKLRSIKLCKRIEGNEHWAVGRFTDSG